MPSDLRSLVAMAICGTPDIDNHMPIRRSVCVCKRDSRPVSEEVPRCLECLMKADAAIIIMQQQEILRYDQYFLGQLKTKLADLESILEKFESPK